MEICLGLPVNGSREQNIYEIIVICLVDEWPLSGCALHRRIKHRHHYEISLQGTHKALKKLMSKKIIVNDGKYYQLNDAWLESIRKFSTNVKNQYMLGENRLEFPV